MCVEGGAPPAYLPPPTPDSGPSPLDSQIPPQLPFPSSPRPRCSSHQYRSPAPHLAPNSPTKGAIVLGACSVTSSSCPSGSGEPAIEAGRRWYPSQGHKPFPGLGWTPEIRCLETPCGFRVPGFCQLHVGVAEGLDSLEDTES
ncbi:unnamed protein product [Lepidochelys kempii]